VIQITIVGAGHYARSIVARKYAECPRCSLRAVITPRVTSVLLRETPLGGLPLARTATEWRSQFATPGDHDLFDLCVHPAVLLPALRSLVEIGARLFVLPKPLATTQQQLDSITALVHGCGARVAVASQWHYSRVTAAVREAAATLTSPLRIEMDFSQQFAPSQLAHYTPKTALLPHMLQILHTADLWRPRDVDTIHSEQYPTHFRAEISTAQGGNTLMLNSNIDSADRRRIMTVSDSTGKRIKADFLGVFRDGIPEKYPAVVINGQREDIIEDNIAVMVRREIAGFLDGAPYLDLDGYLPVNAMLVKLGSAT
jgi:DNA-directed RNA polymerase subunit RPC12/RpoP